MYNNKKLMNSAIDIAVKSAVRTVGGNGQDFVENAIDVAFEPFEKAASFIDSLFDR